jgi:hypothetical protein
MNGYAIAYNLQTTKQIYFYLSLDEIVVFNWLLEQKEKGIQWLFTSHQLPSTVDEQGILMILLIIIYNIFIIILILLNRIEKQICS